jgi:hypothetical protein
MTRTIAAAILVLLALNAPARAAIIQWDFSGVGTNDIIVSGPFPTYAQVSVAGYFDYNTATDNLAAATPYEWQTYENGILTGTCKNGSMCGLGFSNSTLTLDAPTAGPLALFALTAPYPLDGSVPVMAGTNGFLWVNAPFGTVATGSFVEKGVVVTPPSPVPLPATFPLFGTALAGLGGFGWLRRKRGKVSG